MPNAGLKVEGAERVGALVGGELARTFVNRAWPRHSRHSYFCHFRSNFPSPSAPSSLSFMTSSLPWGCSLSSTRELTLTMVGAVLTIAGYSINDTIVVYDRIREGLASGKRGSIEEIMNQSINQTLSRTDRDQHGHVDPNCVPLFPWSRCPARLLARHYYRRSGRHLFLHFLSLHRSSSGGPAHGRVLGRFAARSRKKQPPLTRRCDKVAGKARGCTRDAPFL